jgi:hypothetical protein
MEMVSATRKGQTSPWEQEMRSPVLIALANIVIIGAAGFRSAPSLNPAPFIRSTITNSAIGTTGTSGSYGLTAAVSGPASAAGSSAANTSIISFSQGPDLGTFSIGDVEIPLTATGGNGEYKWSIISGSLPPGMALRTDPASWFPASATAGLIGIVTTPGTYHFTLKVTSGSSSATQDDTLQISSLCAQDRYNIPDAFIDAPYSYSLTALNHSGPVKWTATSSLPAGLKLSSAGILSGTPMDAGSYAISLDLSDGQTTVYRGISLNIYTINIATPAILPNATQNKPYSTKIHASGGMGSYTFTAIGLPLGLSMSASGVISGTPNGGGPGRTGITVTATDSKEHSYTKLMTIDILGTPPALPSVASYNSSSYFDDCTIGVACGDGVNAELGGKEPFTWTAKGLPPGMTVHWTGHGATDSWITPGDAELWGTPTVAGVYNVELTVTDASGVSATNTFPLRVSVLELTNELPNGKLNVRYSSKLRIIGGSQGYSVRASGQLPAALSMDSSDLTLSGTPAESGSSFYAIVQSADSANDKLTVTSYFSIAGAGSGTVQLNTYDALGFWTVGASYFNQLSACCASGYSWSPSGGALPPGLSLTSSGQLTGTLGKAGKYLFSIRVADSSNDANYAVRRFSMEITPLNPTAGSPLPYGDVRVPYSTQLSASGGKGSLTWTLQPNYYLPPGLRLASNGTISGTPTESGQYSFEVGIADQAGNSALYYFDISIYPPSFYTITSVKASCNASLIYYTGTDQCSATVEGTGFFTNVVKWSSSAGSISASGLLSPSHATGSITVTATSTADTKKSDSAKVTSTSIINPVPSISSLSPKSAIAGGDAFALTVDGANFVPGATIQWNGNSRTTTYISKTRLATTIRAADIAAAQHGVITVVNPPLGGGASAEAPFAVNSPPPSGLSIFPDSAAAGGAGFTLTVNGSNFLPGSTVQWNGSYGQPPLSTTYVSPTRLTVAVPAADIAFAGDANVTVVNPAPGGGESQPAVFTITGSIPSDVSVVAPDGNDANPGTITQPYLTIQKCATTISSGSICAIRAGTYRETVTPNSGITITSYDGEPVTVDGSDPVTGWTLYKGSIYKASVTLSSGDTNQIFVGDQMMTEARWPNSNDLFHVNWATAQAGTTTTQVVDSNLPNVHLTGAKIHLWSGSDPWEPQTGTITASSQGQLIFAPDDAGFPPYIQAQAGGYYYLYRSLVLLDTQNEWYYDPTAMVLYFWAPGGVNPSTLDVRAKQRQYAFDLSGQSSVTVEYINIFACTINMNVSSTNNTLEGINAQYVSQFTDLPDTFGPFSYSYDHLTDSGIIINGSGNMLQDSTIAWSAGNGVALLGTNNTVKNNLIHHVDYMAISDSGIVIQGTAQVPGILQLIKANTIYACGRICVLPSPYVAYANITNDDISYNNIFSAMMLSRDAGEIYTSFTTASGTAIQNNWLHDTRSLYSGPADNYPTPGVYLDDYATGWVVDQNILWNNQVFNVFLNGTIGNSMESNPPPENNSVHNNSIPDVSSTAYIEVGEIANCGRTQIANNLVLVPIDQYNTTPPCAATNNSFAAPGATQMTSSVHVGCNFAGCSSEGPPAIVGTSVSASIAVQPYNMTVTAGQPVTFAVTGAGSPTLTYQWQRNGADITGATDSSYTIPATAPADNGAVFTVTVSNSIGTVISDPATLTVQ